MEEIERLKLRAQVVAQAQNIVISNGGEQTAAKVVEAAEVIWAWINKSDLDFADGYEDDGKRY